MPVITLTHLPGTLGEEIARRLSLKLGIPLWERKDTGALFLEDIATPYDIELLDESPKHYLRNAKNGISFRDNVISGLKRFADEGNSVILGIVPALFLRNHPNAIHIHVTAPLELRTERLLSLRGQTAQSVQAEIEAKDRLFKRYGSILFNETSQDPFLYHITINTGNISVDAAVNIIAESYRDHLAREVLLNSSEEEQRVQFRQEESSRMKNPSEIEFAKILDMYHLRWVYEPKTFPLAWDEEGRVTMAFSPDFYLADYDLYLELTVMNPKYTQEKRFKTREIERLYPGTQVRLVQKRDYQHLLRSLEKAGKASLLSNTIDEESEWEKDDELTNS